MEKIVRVNVSGDASGLNKEIARATQEVHKAFGDLGMDGILEDVDKQFDNTSDKVDALKGKLEELNQQTLSEASGGGNDLFQQLNTGARTEHTAKHDKATKALDNFAKTIERHSPSTPSHGKGAAGGLASASRKTGSGTMGRLAGTLTRGGGMAGAMSILAGAGVFAGLAVLAGKFLKLGHDEMMRDFKVNAVYGKSTNFAQNLRQGYDATTGLKQSEFIELAYGIGRSRGSGENLTRDATRRAWLKNGYGLQDQDMSSFDKFAFSGGSDATMIIANLLEKSEKDGILGVDREDFSRIPKAIEVVSSLMGMQKASGETVDEKLAINMVSAGQRIGGRFGDDRLSQVMNNMNSSIKNPTNGGMNAYIFEMLKRSDPNASYTDVLAMRENGASAENLKAVLPEISKMQQGEMRRMILKQLTGNWQDAIRLDSADNLGEMLKATEGTGKIGNNQYTGMYDEMRKRNDELTSEISKGWNSINSSLSNAASDFVTTLNGVVKKVKGADITKEQKQAAARTATWMFPHLLFNKPKSGAE